MLLVISGSALFGWVGSSPVGQPAGTWWLRPKRRSPRADVVFSRSNGKRAQSAPKTAVVSARMCQVWMSMQFIKHTWIHVIEDEPIHHLSVSETAGSISLQQWLWQSSRSAVKWRHLFILGTRCFSSFSGPRSRRTGIPAAALVPESSNAGMPSKGKSRSSAPARKLWHSESWRLLVLRLLSSLRQFYLHTCVLFKHL